jgi:L-alanine-DL-glutamate epimerase-like enolase superfamily enzyme
MAESLWKRVAELFVQIDACELERRVFPTAAGWERVTTVVRLRGGREEGRGEDVTYDADLQRLFQAAGCPPGLEARHALAELSALLDGLPNYQRWAFESAALDLALRQAGRSLAEQLEREPRPVTYVVSTGLGKPASLGRVERLLELDPGLRFKIDSSPTWTDELVAQLAELDVVDIVDLKGAYEGFGDPADPALYRRVAEGLPRAWIEDPDLTREADEVLAPHRDRITWDAIIHSVEDVERLPFPPRCLNCKPSRFGSLRELLRFYDHCTERGIALYGGGQFELGPGRGQIQYLASLFHADAPNDVAPGGYNAVDPPPGLLGSPLQPAPAATGFRWGNEA